VPGPARLEAIDTDLRHAATGALVEPDGEVELLHLVPERGVVWVVEHPPVVRVGAEKAGAHAKLLLGVAHLLDG